MSSNDSAQPVPRPFHIVDLNYVSLYVRDFEAAARFYRRVFGEPGDREDGGRQLGWRMGATWLTLFPGGVSGQPDANPRNAEFAVQVAAPEEVDALHAALLAAGATTMTVPCDTVMYQPMRFACVDDPFGTRIDVYCPLQP